MGTSRIGNTQPSIVRYYAIPISFDMPDLLTGHIVYTPAIGDALIEAVFIIETPWDGQPRIQTVSITGSPAGGTFTLFGIPALDFDVDAATMETAIQTFYPSATVAGTNPDFTVTGGDELFLDANNLTGGTSPDVVIATTQPPGTPKGDIGTFVGTTLGFLEQSGAQETLMDNPSPDWGDGFAVSAAGMSEAGWVLIATDTHPIRVVVTNDATSGGSDPGSTQGSAVLYLTVATPVYI